MPDRIEIKRRVQLYHYVAHVSQVYDGDTITVDIDLGMGVWRHNQVIRFWKVNTPEIRGPEREQGLVVRDFVRGLILDKDILLRTILDKRGDDRTGKYGRLLGEILVESEEGETINVNDLLLSKEFATGMDGGGSIIPAPAAAPQSYRLLPETIDCRYCGEVRAVDGTSRTVAPCPNCLDDAYELALILS